jgi:hypothetical protein
MVASAIFLMDLKGKVIISRNYRGDIPPNVAERFSLYVQEKDEVEMRPVFTIDGLTFVYIKVYYSMLRIYCALYCIAHCIAHIALHTLHCALYCIALHTASCALHACVSVFICVSTHPAELQNSMQHFSAMLLH